MNLLIINLDKRIFLPGSASLERLKEYSQLFDKFFVIVWTIKREKPIIFQERLFVYPTNSRFRLLYFFDTIRIFNYIKKNNKIDLVLTQDLFETGMIGWLISKIHKIPLQPQVHTDFLSPHFKKESVLNNIRVIIAKFLAPRATSLRVVSQRIKKSLMASGYFLSADKIFVLPIFVDVEKIRQAPIKTNLHDKYPQFNFIILMASRLTREKNINLATEVMEDIVKKYPQTGLIIVGQGPEKENLKISKNVIIENWTEDIISYYKTADLFLLTSNYEGYGMSVVEAMTAGCPVIMTDVGCAGEVLLNGDNGLVIPIADGQKLEETVLKLINEPEFAKKLGERAKESVLNLPGKEQNLTLYQMVCRQTITASA